VAQDSMKMLEAANIPCFSSVESCADSISLLFMANGEPADKTLEAEYDEEAINYTLNHQITLGQVDDNGGMLNEVASNAVFTKLGIKSPKQLFIPLRDEEPQIYNDHGLRYPLVAKLVSQDLPHKSEYGAITLEISDPVTLEREVTKMKERVQSLVPDFRLDGVLLQEMASGLGEALIGLRYDNLVGPIITVGAGGVFAEIYKDVCHRPAPINAETARQMIAEVKGFAYLRGYRELPKGDLEALAKSIEALSQLGKNERISEAEINPVLVCKEGVLMLDALIRIAPKS